MNKNDIKQLILKTLIVSITIASVVLIGYSLLNIINVVNFISTLVEILMPFIIGCVIAYLLAPMCTKMKNFMIKHSKMSDKLANLVSISFVEIVTFFFIIICVLIIAPQLITSCINIIESLPSALEDIQVIIAENKHASDIIFSLFGRDLTTEVLSAQETVAGLISEYILPNIDKLVSGVTSSITSLGGALLDTILGIVASIFILLNRRQFAGQIKRLTYAIFGEKVTGYIIEEANIANKMFGGFFIGKIIDSTIIGILCFISLSILRMPYSVLISVIVGITNIVPIFGPFIGAVPGFIFIFAESPLKSIWFVIFILALQQLDGNVIGPKCIGDATGLNTFWVLFAIILFGGLWGIVGMIVGVPLMAVIHDIVEKLVDYILFKRNIPSELLDE